MQAPQRACMAVVANPMLPLMHMLAFGRWWQHRWLLGRFVAREWHARYAGSVAGLAWAFLQPLVLLGIYSLVFVAVFRVRFPEMAGHPFVVFMAVLMWPWLAFTEGLSRGTQAIVANAAIVKKVAFPHALLVVAAVMASFGVHLLGFALVLAALAAFGVSLQWSGLWVALPVLALLLVITVGLALFLSALQVFIRDTEQVLAQVLAILFYLTPILYPMSVVPEFLARWMSLNPLVHVMEPIRAALLFGAWPQPTQWMLMSVFALLTLGGGWWFFARLSPHFEDVV